MIRIVISEAALVAIAKTLPEVTVVHDRSLEKARA